MRNQFESDPVSPDPYHQIVAVSQVPRFGNHSDPFGFTLTRPSATKRLAIIGRTAREVLADYVEAVEVVEPKHVPRVVPGDADDDQVIAAAIASGADWIVSGDADLLSMESYEGIPIITAAQAAQQIGG